MRVEDDAGLRAFAEMSLERLSRMAEQKDAFGKPKLHSALSLGVSGCVAGIGTDAGSSADALPEPDAMERTNLESKMCKILRDDTFFSQFLDEASRRRLCGPLGYVRQRTDQNDGGLVIFQSSGVPMINFFTNGAIKEEVLSLLDATRKNFAALLEHWETQLPERRLRGNYNRVYKLSRDSLPDNVQTLFQWPDADSPREYALRLSTTTAHDKWIGADTKRPGEKRKQDQPAPSSVGYRNLLEEELAVSLHMASIGVAPPLAAGCILDVRGIPRLCLVSSWGGESTFKTLHSYDVENAVINQIVDQYITSCTRVANEGYVNFDVKPANFVVSGVPDAVHVKMIDFGTEYFCLAADTSHEVRLFCMLLLLAMHVIQDGHKRIAEIKESKGITDENQRTMIEKTKRTVHRVVQKMSTALIHCWLQLNSGDELYDRWLLGFKFDHIFSYSRINKREKILRKLLGLITNSYFFKGAKKETDTMEFPMPMSAFSSAFDGNVTAPQLAVPMLMRYIFYKFCGTGSPRDDAEVPLFNSEESYEHYARLHAKKGPLLQNNVDKQSPKIYPMFAHEDLKLHTGAVWFKSFGF